MVKQIKKTARIRKYFAPQTDAMGAAGAHRCAHPGCKELGEYRAPKDKNLKEYYWFCLPHVQEYNAKWNYYDGTIPDDGGEEIRAANRSKFSFKAGAGVRDFTGFFSDYASSMGRQSRPGYTKKEAEALETLEIGEDEELTVERLKRQYKKLARRYHPDATGGDKTKEDRFKAVSAAYGYLLKRL